MPTTPLVLAARRDEPNTALLLLQRMASDAGAPTAAAQALGFILRMKRLAPRLFDACLRLGLPRDAQRQWLTPNVAAGAAGWSITVPQVLVYEAGAPATNRQLLLFFAVWFWCMCCIQHRKDYYQSHGWYYALRNVHCRIACHHPSAGS